MSIEIPEFLLEMSKQMHEQDNRLTAHPIWTVCYDEEYVTQDGYNESYIAAFDEEGNKICNDDDLTELAEYLEENHEDWFNKFLADYGVNDSEEPHEEFCSLFCVETDDLPEGLKFLAIAKRMKPVKYCLTESDAKAFIKRKQHDYPKLYTYVESMVFCPQMIDLRNWIMSLSGES